jgi:hypothetical protein
MDLTDPTTLALLAADAFEERKLPSALYGGLMLAAYGEPRETRDADLAVLTRGTSEACEALAAKGARVLVTFEEVTFGGLFVSRLTVLGPQPPPGNLNTVDLVRPRSDRFAAAVLDRAVRVTLRGVEIVVVSPEDFVLLKVLSTRERDLDDAASVLRRSGEVMDRALVETELTRLASELPDTPVRGRAAEVEARARDSG